MTLYFVGTCEARIWSFPSCTSYKLRTVAETSIHSPNFLTWQLPYSPAYDCTILPLISVLNILRLVLGLYTRGLGRPN
jgi:hypothetical protein